MIVEASLLLAALLLAFTNGANDNFKGVATLYGSGALGYRAAISLATVSTLLGSLAGLYFATSLVVAFSGKGLVPDSVAADPRFLANVGGAAGLTVLAATRLGFPISTTHALVGALVGAGWVATAEVQTSRLLGTFVAPLALSPLLATVAAGAEQRALGFFRRRREPEEELCVCVGEELAVAGTGAAPAAAMTTIAVGTAESCDARFAPGAATLTEAGFAHGLHCVSAATVSFARGVNDTPKILALLLATELTAPAFGVTLVGLTIAIGGWLGARRVAETMSHRITAMTTGEALTANLTTAFLVLGASRFGLPVSTTHVSCGALFGIGAVNGRASWRTIGQIVLAWVITLPVAAATAAALASW